jgi:hypothetical protein
MFLKNGSISFYMIGKILVTRDRTVPLRDRTSFSIRLPFCNKKSDRSAVTIA